MYFPYTLIHTCIQTHDHILIHTNICTYIYMYEFAAISLTHTHTHTHTHTYTHCMYCNRNMTYNHTCRYIYTIMLRAGVFGIYRS